MPDPWSAQMEALGVERGMHQPSERVLKLIAQALNISAETLLIQAGLLYDSMLRSDRGR